MAKKGNPPLNNQTPIDQLTYEQAFTEYEAIVTALESGEHPLEASLALFERGQALARYCIEKLDKADLKIQQLSDDTLIPFSMPE
jgi:exodeoxyribonuclease VII small subunit